MVRNILPRMFDLNKVLQDHEDRITELERQLFSLGQWAPYTPTFSGFTPGNATIEARWTRAGATAFVKVRIQLGSTSSVTGVVEVSTPIPGRSTAGFVYPMGVALSREGTASGSNVFKGFVTNSGSGQITEMRVVQASNTSGGVWNSTTPFAWNTNSWLTIDASYEIN